MTLDVKHYGLNDISIGVHVLQYVLMCPFELGF